MKAEFWHDRWEANQIGFHKDVANPLLIAHLPALGLAAGALSKNLRRALVDFALLSPLVVVPLCGGG